MARRLLVGLLLVVVMVASVGGWAATTPIGGAVIASGFVVVESNIKKVQHPTGGIVAAITIKNGNLVNAGDVVVSLDDTQARANLGIVASQLVQLGGRKARLEAERDQTDQVRFPAGFVISGEDAVAIMEGEKRLFEVRQSVKNGQIAQFTERIGQLRQEIKGITAQRDAKAEEVELMREELERLEGMRKKDLVPTTRTLQAQRDLTRLRGEWGAHVAQIARSQGQISETELQIIAVTQNMQTDASKELREIEARIAELLERKIAAEDQLKRIYLRAPQTGYVHDLTVHTIGGVIGPGESVMTIVPTHETLSVEARIGTADIDQVAVGQEAVLRFPALNQRTTPEIKGTVSRIGADLTKDPQANSVYFTLRISVADNDRDAFRLVPGMPVEAFISTHERTALSYLMKPISDQVTKAFRER
ncbi:MAG TPA: HlyD family type I secretion periplasmic adaptor subunit [Hyphomicrobiaceae bacterium]|nr:HlyD family type I secretion periplasmic adaptor subunit [Hyphomicrobiaceae bacterium]